MILMTWFMYLYVFGCGDFLTIQLAPPTGPNIPRTHHRTTFTFRVMSSVAFLPDSYGLNDAQLTELRYDARATRQLA